MPVSPWVKRLVPVFIIAVLSGLYLFLDGPVSSESWAGWGEVVDQPSTLADTSEEGVGRGSERYRIVDDTLEGDVSDAARALEEGGTVTAVTTVETNAVVLKVVDGDTIDVRLDSGEEARVRLLGVNTPETVDPRRPVECFGKEASAFTKSRLADARIRLDADPQADERDAYGRLLRNVTLEDGTDFNATLVSEGYAHAYVSFPINPERKKQLIDLEKEAKEADRGLWGEGVCE